MQGTCDNLKLRRHRACSYSTHTAACMTQPSGAASQVYRCALASSCARGTATCATTSSHSVQCVPPASTTCAVSETCCDFRGCTESCSGVWLRAASRCLRSSFLHPDRDLHLSWHSRQRCVALPPTTPSALSPSTGCRHVLAPNCAATGEVSSSRLRDACHQPQREKLLRRKAATLQRLSHHGWGEVEPCTSTAFVIRIGPSAGVRAGCHPAAACEQQKAHPYVPTRHE